MFFFKQKTAYEMRISDWSSDVCSSDLRNAALRGFAGARGGRAGEGTMLRTLIVLLLALLGAANVATAAVPETPRLRIIGAAQGLPSTDFFGIARDRDGYIWVATGDGLARYDGDRKSPRPNSRH